MKNKKISLIILFITTMIWASQSFPLEKITHQAINKNIANRTINGFSLNNYLINDLGFKEGIKEKLRIGSEEKEIFRWIGDGGQKEDEPDGLIRTVLNRGRSNNHFHNPLETWDQAGLDAYIGPLHYSGQSSILWSQNSNQDPGGKWSWYDARDYFYKGLTLTSKLGRDSAMANTFRALGQLMHLIEDASVPAHVRNDINIEGLYV